MPTTVVTRESSVEIEILIDEEGFTQALRQAASLRGFRTQYRPITHQRSITMKKSELSKIKVLREGRKNKPKES